MCLAGAIVGLAMVFAQTGLPTHLREIVPIARLLSGGLFSPTPVNGVPVYRLNAGVTWTLAYEWNFYLALPLLALFTRPWQLAVMFALVLLASTVHHLPLLPGSFHYPGTIALWANFYQIFLYGMLVAQIYAATGPLRPFQGFAASILCLACLVALPVFCNTGYTPAAYVLSCVVFFCIANGNSIFGLLNTRRAKMLGAASYSIYLTHGIVLNLVSPWLHFGITGCEPGIAYWLEISLVGCIVVVICALTYRYIEKPFIDLSRGRKRVGPAPAVAAQTATVDSAAP